MNKHSSKHIILWSKAFLALIAGVFIVSFASGCADSSSPSSDATVNTRTEMGSTSVNSTTSKGAQTVLAKGLTCDSLHISSATLLISSLKLHHDESDSVDGGTIRTVPFVAEFDAALGARLVSTVTIPTGTYDRIKFEFHKLKDGLEDALINDPIFGEFVSGGRYTAIIKGDVFVAGVAYPFVFRSSQTENVQVRLDPPVTFEGGKEYDLVLTFDPSAVFAQVLGRPLDPRDVDNQKDIEKQIKLAIKANKR